MNRARRSFSAALLIILIASFGSGFIYPESGPRQGAAPVSSPRLRPLDSKPLLDYVDKLLARFEKPADGSLEAYTAALKRLTGRWNDALRREAQAAGAETFAAYKKAFPEAGSFDTIFVNIQSSDPATARRLKAAKEFIAGDSIDGFLSPTDIDRRLDGWVRDHPRYASVRTFGRTTLGRPMRVLEITDREAPNDGKPAILFDALTHPVEILTGDAALGIAERLLAGASADPEIRKWLRGCRILIVPVVNPDGLALVWSGEIGWRKNARLKDGRIYGVDINRNFPSLWQACEPPANRDPESIYCGGQAAASEPETRALMELIAESKPVLGLSFHTQGETLIFPYGCKSVMNEARPLFLDVAAKLTRDLRSASGKTAAYRIGNSPEIYYEAAGSMIDWAWSAQGSLSCVLEFLNKDSGARARTVDREKLADKMAPAWKGALRRLEGSGVRARVVVRSAEGAAGLTYTITPEGAGYPAEFSRKKWTLRTPGGLLYNLLLPGSYRFDFFLGDEKIKTVSANVGAGLVDLGTIELNRGD